MFGEPGCNGTVFGDFAVEDPASRKPSHVPYASESIPSYEISSAPRALFLARVQQEGDASFARAVTFRL